jgi:hypothetical protein
MIADNTCLDETRITQQAYDGHKDEQSPYHSMAEATTPKDRRMAIMT